MAAARLQDVEVLTFDLYGTIADMQRGLVETIAPFLEARSYTGSPSAIVTLPFGFSPHQPDLEVTDFRSLADALS